MKTSTVIKKKPAKKKAMRNATLSRKILSMLRSEQAIHERAARKSGESVLAAAEKVNARNLAEIKKIIKRYGWPKISTVGERAAGSFWVLVQNADRDVAFQKVCLKLLKEAVKKGEAEAHNVAYLTDRILMNQGKKQRYGTQTYRREFDGVLDIRPVETPELLDARRAKFGLPPIDVYLHMIEQYFKKAKTSN